MLSTLRKLLHPSSEPKTGSSAVGTVGRVDDLGMHIGEDTAFYLKKGFRVVAIEGDPKLAEAGQNRFREDIVSGRLRLLNVTIAERAGPITFYRNDKHHDWGTTSDAFVSRNAKLGSEHQAVKTTGVRFDDVVRENGVPYYLKIDVEGADLLCLQALAEFETRPLFVSIEMTLDNSEEVFTEFSTLWLLGYRKFKILNQDLNSTIRLPHPPLEGRYVEPSFSGYSSGPFGRETPGEWLTIEAALTTARKIVDEQSLHGGTGSEYHTEASKHYRAYRSLIGDPIAWYDIHATF